MKRNVDYAISRGLHYKEPNVIGISGKVLRPRGLGKGYVGYQIPRPEGGYINIYAHKLIYYLVTGDERALGSEYEVHHDNGIRDDNSPSNLVLMIAHDHESMSSRLNTRNAHIDLITAKEIRARYKAGGISQKSLGKIYGLSQQHVCDIIAGRKWGDKWDADME